MYLRAIKAIMFDESRSQSVNFIAFTYIVGTTCALTLW